MPKVVWTYYLLYILTTGTDPKPHFLTPRSKQNAGLFRMVPRMPPRSCKMTPTVPKNGESGVSRGSQGCQRVHPMPPKMLQKSSKINTPLQDCLQGCFWGALGSPGDPTLAILRPLRRHFAAPRRHPRHHAEKTCILLAPRCQKVRFSEGADSAVSYTHLTLPTIYSV